MATTIRDVARRAQVSTACVSRALNGGGSMTAQTRERVLAAARELRYTPHGAARSLTTRRTNTVGVLLPDIYGEYFSELIRGIDRAARARGLHLLVSGSHGDSAEAAAALRAMNGRVDGLLLMSPHVTGDALGEALPAHIPAVLMSTRVAADAYSSFMVDNYGGAYAMTRQLLAGGCRRIAHLRGPEGNFESLERERGYRAALAAHGRGVAPQVLDGDFTEESGYRAGRALVALRERPDAVFAANDMMAIGCLFALTEAGLRVPQDMALGGFDDIPIARYVSPPLATVRIDIAAMGRLALEQLVAQMEAGEAAARVQVTLPTELVLRASCGGREST